VVVAAAVVIVVRRRRKRHAAKHFAGLGRANDRKVAQPVIPVVVSITRRRELPLRRHYKAASITARISEG